MDVVGFTPDLGNFTVQFCCQMSYCFKEEVSSLSGECMLTKLGTENDVCAEVVDAMACNVEVERTSPARAGAI